jgi:hypothetical protein
MAELFLSYAHQDIGRAQTLAQLLEANGLTVWWDRRMIAGDKINDVIDEELEKAKGIIVLWSRISVKSDWVRGEASTAQELGKLIPIKIEDCKLPIQYRGIHTPEVYKGKGELQKLAKILSDKFRPAQPLKLESVPQPTTEKIEFSGNSVSDFFAKLGAERAAYKREWWSLNTIKKHPVGAALQLGFGVLILLVFISYVIFQVVTSKLMNKLPDWATNLIAGAILFIYICWAVYAWVVKRRRQGS